MKDLHSEYKYTKNINTDLNMNSRHTNKNILQSQKLEGIQIQNEFTNEKHIINLQIAKKEIELPSKNLE